jgi:hypothetical protein
LIDAAAPRPWASWGRLVAWVAVTYLGFVFFGGNHLQALGPTAAFHPADIDTSAAIVGFVFGAVAGSIIGFLQWLVLRSWAPRTRGWIPLTALGFGLAHAFNDAVPYRPLDVLVIVLADGLVIGALQSIALRHELPRPWVWVPVVAVAWVLGLTLGIFLLIGIVSNPLAELVVGHGAAGLVIGLITGTALFWQVGPRSSESEVSASGSPC